MKKPQRPTILNFQFYILGRKPRISHPLQVIFALQGKNNLPKKKSTMLPFVLSLSKGRLSSLLRKS
jgi:hypothetical protein